MLASAALAIKLTNKDVVIPDSVLPSVASGLSNEFDKSECFGEIPTYMYDPVCFSGQWIEFDDLEDPDFLACGQKPDPAVLEYPVCNHEEGKWSAFINYSDSEDQFICGNLPYGIGYAVCNHVTSMWVEFQPVTEYCFQVCGEKPANVGFVMCNHDSMQWEQTGSVHPPNEPICGSKPDTVSDSAICNSETAMWEEVIIADPLYVTCPDPVPENIQFAVCNTETGEWEEDYIGLQDTVYDAIGD